jgi:glycosyltransferase involved in cell wall biosynthesis
MKILWLTPPSKGIYSPIYNELARSHKDIEFVMVLPDQVRHKDVGVKNFRAVYMPTREWAKLVFFPLYFYNLISRRPMHDFPSNVTFKDFSDLASKEKPDIIIVNEMYLLYSLQAARYCKKHNVPLVFQTEMQRFNSLQAKSMLKIFFNMFRKSIFKQPRLIQCWSKNALEFMKKETHVEKSKLKLFMAGIDTKVFYPRRSLKASTIKIIMVSRFVPYKRHVDLLQAALILKKKGVDFSISLLGEGPLKDDVLMQIKQHSLENEVKILSKVPYEKMPELYSRHDIIVLPSYNEAIGMVVPEAMACGASAIVSDTCGANMYVKDGVNGYVFRTYDSKDLANKIMNFKSKSKRSVFGKRASKDIKENYDVRIVSEEFLKQVIGCLNK